MGQEITPEIRREVILATGLCVYPDCKGHDDVVLRIWEYKREAVEQAWKVAGKILG